MARLGEGELSETTNLQKNRKNVERKTYLFSPITGAPQNDPTLYSQMKGNTYCSELTPHRIRRRD